MQLRDYQLADVERIKQQNQIAVFSEQRTGKTPTTIVGLWEKGVRRPLIVCPNSLVYNWKYEYERWTGSKALVVTSTKVDLKSEWVGDCALIINYEKLRDTARTEGMWRKIQKLKPEAVVLDEAHKIKNRMSKTAKACYKFCNVPVRVALTGTPAPNREIDIYGILHFLDRDTYSSYWRFAGEYFTENTIWVAGNAITEPGKFKPGKEKEFQAELDKLAIQHKRAHVMDWVTEAPEPTVIALPCTKAQTKHLTELEKWFETEHIITQTVLDRLVRVRQICAAPGILDLKGNSPKADWLEQYLFDNPDKSIIVFSNSTKFINLLAADYPNSGIITGQVPLPERQTYIQRFQDKEINLIFIQTQAGKEGLTLDQADVTIFLDVYPPAADYQQAKDRMVSTTPERVKEKEIIHVMMAGTYDEQLYSLVAKNISATAVINDYIDYIKRRNQIG